VLSEGKGKAARVILERLDIPKTITIGIEVLWRSGQIIFDGFKAKNLGV